MEYAYTAVIGNKLETGWRLPNVHELESLLNYDEAADTWLEANGFANIYLYYYWTSTSVDSDYAYVVTFPYGRIESRDKDESCYVLVVKDME